VKSATAEFSAQDTSQAHAGELRHLAWVVGSMAAIFLLSYALPFLTRFRPLLADEGLPIVRMFKGSQESELPGFAEAGLITRAGVSEQQLAKTLGAHVASNLGEARDTPPQDARDVRGAAGQGPDATGPSSGPALRIAPEEYADIPRSIEFAQNLRPFFTALERSAMDKPGAITRIAHYGDSAVAADAIASTARRRFQKRFGDAGHGFILISRGNMHYAHKDVLHRTSKGWSAESAVQKSIGEAWYGYGGVQLRGRAGESALIGTVKEGPIGTRVSRFELFYQRHKRGGHLQVKIDGEAREPIDTRADTREDAFERYDLPDGPHTLSLRAVGGGESRLYGVVLERDEPGVVYDSLGLVGGRAQRLLNLKAAHIKRQIAHRDPDLLVLGFGGNESANSWLNMERYEQELVQVVKHMRAGKPKMACLLFAPLDQGEHDKRGKVVTVETLPQIVEVQRRVAKRLGCAFFDTFTAMGGEGSMARWRKSRPRLATSDLRHATPEGYEVIGNLYYKAMLEAFATHLKSR